MKMDLQRILIKSSQKHLRNIRKILSYRGPGKMTSQRREQVRVAVLQRGQVR